MKIQVVFINGTTGTISIDDVDELVDKKVIIGIRRLSGWAMIGIDEFRSNRSINEGSWRDRKTYRMLMAA